MGIRKVLGASVTGIIALLSIVFLKLMLITIGSACPIVWLAMHRWMQDFAYKVGLDWWLFTWLANH